MPTPSNKGTPDIDIEIDIDMKEEKVDPTVITKKNLHRLTSYQQKVTLAEGDIS
jgi:hypothetical protein